MPATTQRYGGIINSLTKFEDPDQTPFDAPEIEHRLTKKHHVGLVLAGEENVRVASLLDRYRNLILRDYSAALPQQKHGHTGV